MAASGRIRRLRPALRPGREVVVPGGYTTALGNVISPAARGVLEPSSGRWYDDAGRAMRYVRFAPRVAYWLPEDLLEAV